MAKNFDFNSEKDVDTLKAKLEKTTESAKKDIDSLGIKAGLEAAMLKAASGDPDYKFPSGLNAGQTAEVIFKALTSYHDAFSNQIKEDTVYSTDDVKTLFFEEIEGITDDQSKKEVVILMKLYCDYFKMDADTPVTRESLMEEYEEMKSKAVGKNTEIFIEEIVETIDYSEFGSMVDSFEALADECVNPQDYTGVVVDALADRFTSLHDMAVEVAASYTVALNGGLPGVSPEVDPGAFAVQYAARKDAFTVTQMYKENLISEEKKESLLKKIAKAFAVAVSVAVAALCAVLVYKATGVLIAFLIALEVSNPLLSIGAVLATIYYLKEYSGVVFNKTREISERIGKWLGKTIKKFRNKDKAENDTLDKNFDFAKN